MTTIDVDTSPLQAAREWRGIGVVVAARNAGIPVAQAEALEDGNPAEFDSIDEMIASAVVYGASIGIGRDEAMALLDRTVCRTGAQVALPDVGDDARPSGRFTSAVRTRSARISDSDMLVSAPLPAFLDDEPEADLDNHRVLDPIVADPAAPASPDVEMPDVPGGPTPEQAVAASGEIHIDNSAFGPETSWEDAAGAPHANSHSTFAASGTGELEAWAAEDYVDDEFEGGSSVARRAGGHGVMARIGGGSHAIMERVLGTDRADGIADRTSSMFERVGETATGWRESLRRSEHATLIVAIGGGAVLIALLVAIGGALGGQDAASRSEPATDGGPTLTTPGAQGVAEEPAADAPAAAPSAAPAATKPAAKPAAKVVPVVAPSQLTVDVYNAGRQKGLAKDVAAQLDAADYRIGEVTNAKGTYNGPTIIYPKAMLREARVISRRTGITSLQAAPGTSRRFTVVVA